MFGALIIDNRQFFSTRNLQEILFNFFSNEMRKDYGRAGGHEQRPCGNCWGSQTLSYIFPHAHRCRHAVSAHDFIHRGNLVLCFRGGSGYHNFQERSNPSPSYRILNNERLAKFAANKLSNVDGQLLADRSSRRAEDCGRQSRLGAGQVLP